ncbi:MAG: ABC transporter ATP-binding protein/permease [Anaerolineae bacterium]|nr:ABC transporter ATP-binding protein/permease [Anaerolineae bacterium]
MPRRYRDRPVPDVPIDARRILHYLRPYWKRMALACIALLGATLLGLIFPMVVKNLLDEVLLLESSAQLNRLTLGLMGVFLLQSVFKFVQNYQLAYVGELIILDLREHLFNHLTRLSLGFFSDRRTGELVSRFSSDSVRLRGVLTSQITTILSQGMTLVGSLVMMIYLNWRLMAFIVVIVPIITGIGRYFGVWMRKLSTEKQDAVAASMVAVEEAISGIRVVKSFAREDFEEQRYRKSQDDVFHVARKNMRLNNIFNPLMSFVGFTSLSAFLWMGGREVLDGNLSAGELVAFMFYGSNVAGSLTSFVGVYTSLQEALGGTKRIFEIIDMQPEIADKPHAKPLPPVKGDIQFEDVSFTYREGVPVLHNIDLTVRSGEILALVGPSGAGKTTLFNLIPRFYDPDSGRICVDGIDIRDVTQRSLRSQIGIVPQDTQLFGGTIRDNILYGKLEATDAELIEAARAANAHDFITEFPEGYDTVVGERGVKLSGGQRQRIAIARAILKNPRLLLLDEATSSFDSESEQLVQEALQRLMHNRTTIIIAHRLSTIKSADRIVVLQKGRIVELGAHEQLMAHDQLYARLYNMQYRELETV